MGAEKGLWEGEGWKWVENHFEFCVLRCSTFSHAYYFKCFSLYVVTFFFILFRNQLIIFYFFREG